MQWEEMAVAAKAKLTAAEARAEMLRAELGRLESQIAKYREFLAVGDELGHGDNGRDGMPSGDGQIKVQGRSLAGMAAKFILEQGPLTLDELIERLKPDGAETGFRGVLNSGLWRRKSDLFLHRNDGKYDVRSREIVFTESTK
jgi:hypothetical protein